MLVVAQHPLPLRQNVATSEASSNFFWAMSWIHIGASLINRFSDGRNKFRYRLEVEHCIIGDGEEIRNFLHRIKRTVDKGWPDDFNGIEAAQQNAEREAQRQQRRQRWIDYLLKRLWPRYLHRKAQGYLIENPNVTWIDFSTRKIHKDVSLQISPNFLHDKEQTNSQMATMGQEIKNLRSEVQEHRVNAVDGNPRTMDPSQKIRQNTTRFYNYCRTNGHTPTWCRKKIRDEELKRIEKERTAEKKQHVYSGLQQKTSTRPWIRTMDWRPRFQKKETTTLLTMELGEVPLQLLQLIRIFLSGHTSRMGITIRTKEDHMINHSIEAMEVDLEMDFSTNRKKMAKQCRIFAFSIDPKEGLFAK